MTFYTNDYYVPKPDLFQNEIMVEDPRVTNFEYYLIDTLTKADIDQLTPAEGVDDLSELEDLFTKRAQKILKGTTVTYVRLLCDFVHQGSTLDRTKIVDFFNCIRYKLLLDVECNDLGSKYNKTLDTTSQNYVNLGYAVGALAGQDYQSQYTAFVDSIKFETLTRNDYLCSCCCTYCDKLAQKKDEPLWKLWCAFTGLHAWVYYAALVPLKFLPNGTPYIVTNYTLPFTRQ